MYQASTYLSKELQLAGSCIGIVQRFGSNPEFGKEGRLKDEEAERGTTG